MQKNRAVFLDRDGVLCEDTNYVTSYEKLYIYDFSKDAVDLIHKAGYLAVVITNQSGVARGMMTEDTVQELNRYLQEITGVDAVYYCPHLPPEDGEDECPPYRIHCSCRKPGIGMLLAAAADYDIDLTLSYMVGDRESDIETGRRAGCKTVYISECDEEMGDIRCANVMEFAKGLTKKMLNW